MEKCSIKFKSFISIVIFILAFFAIEQGVAADSYYGLETSAPPALKSNTDVPVMIGKIVGIGLSFVGILFFILMIYGGILWMTARGNEQQVEKAKELIIAAVIGLIIVLSAYAITAYIGTSITKTS